MATTKKAGERHEHVWVCKGCGAERPTARPGSGGVKGQAILDAFATHPEGATRGQVAEEAGCTVGRVGEVVRDRAAEFERTEGGLWRLRSAKRAPAKKAQAKKAAPAKRAAAKKETAALLRDAARTDVIGDEAKRLSGADLAIALEGV